MIGGVISIIGDGMVTHVVAGGSSLRRGEAGLWAVGGGVDAGVQEGVVTVGVETAGGTFGVVV